MPKKTSRYSPTEHLGMNAVEGVFLRMKWIKRPQLESDMGIDLIVEECNSGNPTGRLLGVQVKAGASYWKETSKGAVVFRFDQTHHDYWIGHTLPILVVLYHPKDKTLIWESVSSNTCQKANSRWKIRIPLSQSLTPRRKVAFAKLARPLTPQDLIKEEQRRFEVLDPRFRATMVVSEQNSHTTFHAIEDVPIQFSFPGNPEEVTIKIDSLIEGGRSVEFSPSDVSISGSPIFDHIWQDAEKVQLHIGTALNVFASLSCTKVDEEPVFEEVRIDPIAARITAGRSRFTFALADPSFPLELSSEQALDLSGDSSTPEMGFSVDKWYGKPLLHLPHFDQIEGLARSLSRGKTLMVECRHEGKRLFSARATGMTSGGAELLEFVEFLNKARSVARRLHLNPLFRELSDEEASGVSDLFDLCVKGEHLTQSDNFSISGAVNVDAAFLNLPVFINKGEPFQVMVELQHFKGFRFFEKTVETPIRLIATRVLLKNREEILRVLQEKTGNHLIHLDFKGCPGSQIIRRLISSDEVTGLVSVKSEND